MHVWKIGVNEAPLSRTKHCARWTPIAWVLASSPQVNKIPYANSNVKRKEQSPVLIVTIGQYPSGSKMRQTSKRKFEHELPSCRLSFLPK